MSKKPQIIKLPKFLDKRGNLSFIEEEKHIPFKIQRTYWIYDVPGGEARGGHAYKTNEEFIVALSGSFDVILDDGEEKKIFFRYKRGTEYRNLDTEEMIYLSHFQHAITIHLNGKEKERFRGSIQEC